MGLFHSKDCAPVTTVGSANFNLTEWTRASWFPQQQQVTRYQQEASLFCVAATYELEGKRVPFFHGDVVSVYNQANMDAVNGPNVNANDAALCARAADSDDRSKLSVAPCWLPNLFAGPYWVLEIGRNATAPYEYDWAIVIGGQPTEEYDDGCTTKENRINNAGLWLFTRAHVASPELITQMRGLLTERGIAVSRLKDVAQQGCTYEGYRLKP